MEKVRRLSEKQARILSFIEAVAKNVAKPGEPEDMRIHSLANEVMNHMRVKGIKYADPIKASDIYTAIERFRQLGILRDIEMKRVNGEKVPSITFSFSRKVAAEIKEAGIIVKKPQNQVEVPDMELVARVKEFIQGKKNERKGYAEALTRIDHEIEEAEQALENYKKGRAGMLLIIKK
jgi:hypothetical protein